ncbi:MAG: hypothetical protein ACRDAM_09715, partial [Casimicrobium sp.]
NTDLTKANNHLWEKYKRKTWENIIVACHGLPGFLHLCGGIHLGNVAVFAGMLKDRACDIWLVGCNVAAKAGTLDGMNIGLALKLTPLLEGNTDDYYDYYRRTSFLNCFSSDVNDDLTRVSDLSTTSFCAQLARMSGANVWASPHIQYSAKDGTTFSKRTYRHNQIGNYEGQLMCFKPGQAAKRVRNNAPHIPGNKNDWE